MTFAILDDDDIHPVRSALRSRESRGNALLGKRRKFRKITFMFPNQESQKSKASKYAEYTANKNRNSAEETELMTEVTGISCDIIEHIWGTAQRASGWVVSDPDFGSRGPGPEVVKFFSCST